MHHLDIISNYNNPELVFTQNQKLYYQNTSIIYFGLQTPFQKLAPSRSRYIKMLPKDFIMLRLLFYPV